MLNLSTRHTVMTRAHSVHSCNDLIYILSLPVLFLKHGIRIVFNNSLVCIIFLWNVKNISYIIMKTK
jgi:hypothetical protein